MLIRRALLAVSETAPIDMLAKVLVAAGIEVVATKANAVRLAASGVPTIAVADWLNGATTFAEGSPLECLEPRVLAGLALHEADDRTSFDLLIVSLPVGSREKAPGPIDFGPGTLVRAAAWSAGRVVVLVDPEDYPVVGRSLRGTGEIDPKTRHDLIQRALGDLVCSEASARWVGESSDELPPLLPLMLRRASELPSGWNAHQRGSLYGQDEPAPGTLPQALLFTAGDDPRPSFSCARDATAATQLVADLPEPAFALYVRGRPIAVAMAKTAAEALAPILSHFSRAFSDPVLACNRELDDACAASLRTLRLGGLIVPSFAPTAIDSLKASVTYPLIALRDLPPSRAGSLKVTSVEGAFLVQDSDASAWGEVGKAGLLTQRPLAQDELRALELAWTTAAHAPSDSVVIARSDASGLVRTLAIVSGAAARREAIEEAFTQAGAEAKGAVLASDGPIADADDLLRTVRGGVAALAHPGGASDAQVVASRPATSLLVVGRSHLS